ncbi:unnamed protein product [marine sediment metagenome]|uniref:Uncharacterized protein n=1 Tax=marine sediment metagenome TaxID=412755 RepID=X1TIP3_9ZZZZ
MIDVDTRLSLYQKLAKLEKAEQIAARAEVAGVECRVGLFTRGERVIVLALGLLLSQFKPVLALELGQALEPASVLWQPGPHAS